MATIPTGWALCDGSSGTPDLTDTFVRGASNSVGQEPGTSGGSTQHSHSVDPHTHDVDPPSAGTTSDGSHTHDYSGTTTTETQGGLLNGIGLIGPLLTRHTHDYSGTTTSDGGHTHSVDIPSVTSGASTPHGTDSQNHVPPFYRLAYIMKL